MVRWNLEPFYLILISYFDLKIPHKLSEVANIKENEIDKLSQMALEDPSTPGNPKKLTLEDMKMLYKYSLEGKLF